MHQHTYGSYLFQCYGDSVLPVPASGGHERVTHVYREPDTDADPDDDLDRCDGTQSDAPELHQTSDAHNHADH